MHRTLKLTLEHEFKCILACYKRTLSQAKTHEARYDLAFSSYLTTSFYKVFIDKSRLADPSFFERDQEPHLIFDVDEPGYFDSMTEAFAQVRSSLSVPMTLVQPFSHTVKTVQGCSRFA